MTYYFFILVSNKPYNSYLNTRKYIKGLGEVGRVHHSFEYTALFHRMPERKYDFLKPISAGGLIFESETGKK